MIPRGYQTYYCYPIWLSITDFPMIGKGVILTLFTKNKIIPCSGTAPEVCFSRHCKPHRINPGDHSGTKTRALYEKSIFGRKDIEEVIGRYWLLINEKILKKRRQQPPQELSLNITEFPMIGKAVIPSLFIKYKVVSCSGSALEVYFSWHYKPHRINPGDHSGTKKEICTRR